MADEDAYTVTAYRMLAIAVRNEQRAFTYFAYGVSMRTGSRGSSPRLWRTRGSGTPPRCGMSAARLGDERRVALVAIRRPEASVNSGASRHVSRAPWRSGMARSRKSPPALATLQVPVLRSVAAEAAVLLPAESTRRRPPTPWCRRRQPTPSICCALP